MEYAVVTYNGKTYTTKFTNSQSLVDKALKKKTTDTIEIYIMPETWRKPSANAMMKEVESRRKGPNKINAGDVMYELILQNGTRYNPNC